MVPQARPLLQEPGPDVRHRLPLRPGRHQDGAYACMHAETPAGRSMHRSTEWGSTASSHRRPQPSDNRATRSTSGGRTTTSSCRWAARARRWRSRRRTRSSPWSSTRTRAAPPRTSRASRTPMTCVAGRGIAWRRVVGFKGTRRWGRSISSRPHSHAVPGPCRWNVTDLTYSFPPHSIHRR